MNKIRIDHSSIEIDFISHISLEDNNRILFTAPFGAGKSTFLKETFEKSKDLYFTINLFPVNYSVTANEDVFELIKFDLLIELLGNHKKYIDLVNEEFSALLLSQMFILKELKLTPIIFAVLKQCGKIGKSAVNIVEEVKRQYDVFKINADEKNNEKELIETFMNLIEHQKGSEYEMDSISRLIKNLVCQIKRNLIKERISKENESKNINVQSVLIIDDIDRLDPDHTFRLINIFSAHFNKIDYSNKFGFDKVIFVCDFENIKKIFHHKYGPDVDFSGYTDKFFSLIPYDFDNRQYIKEKTGEIIERMEFAEGINLFKKNDRFFNSLKAIIQSFIDTKQLNLRMLLSYPKLIVNEIHFGKNRNYVQNIAETPIVVIFYLLKNFFGSFETLHFKLKYLHDHLDKNNYTSNSNNLFKGSGLEFKALISYCLPFILPGDIPFKEIEKSKIYLEKYECTFHYNGLPFPDFSLNFQSATKNDDENSEEIFLNPYQVLLDVFDICNKMGVLK